jgi:dTDP-4-amino-4,6-dideoxygalactose transaminase
MNKIPFSPPRIDQDIIDSVVSALQSGWITTGPKTKSLEKEISRITGTEKCLCVNSATAGMELMLRWFGIGEGDEVIIPAYTYCSTANVVVHLGAKPIMIDVNARDLCMSIDQIEDKITENTKAIIGVDLAGLPVRSDLIMQIAESNKDKFVPKGKVQEQLGRMLVMTDAAHSIGAKLNHKAAVLSGDVSVYSFHAVKNLTTAEGGAVNLNLKEYFDEDAIYKYLNTMSLHGQSKDALEKFGKGSWEYDVIDAGYKCNMPDVLAAIGLVEIERYEKDTLVKRKHIYDHYLKCLAGTEGLVLPFMEDEKRTGSYHLFLLRLASPNRPLRDQIIERMANRGISLNVHYKPLPLLTAYSSRGYTMDAYAISDDLFNSVISLPVFYDLTFDQVDYICTELKNLLSELS